VERQLTRIPPGLVTVGDDVVLKAARLYSQLFEWDGECYGGTRFTRDGKAIICNSDLTEIEET